MRLEDTIGMMCSDDYKLRMKAEYLQLVIRMGSLENRLGEVEGASHEGQSLRTQRNAMKYYRDALANRMMDMGTTKEMIELLDACCDMDTYKVEYRED